MFIGIIKVASLIPTNAAAALAAAASAMAANASRPHHYNLDNPLSLAMVIILIILKFSLLIFSIYVLFQICEFPSLRRFFKSKKKKTDLEELPLKLHDPARPATYCSGVFFEKKVAKNREK